VLVAIGATHRALNVTLCGQDDKHLIRIYLLYLLLTATRSTTSTGMHTQMLIPQRIHYTVQIVALDYLQFVDPNE
jgi:hypothetical protein